MNSREEVWILGSGCARFGERPDATFSDLLCEAVFEALWDSGVGPERIDGAWLAVSDRGERRRSPAALTEAVGLGEIPVTRVAGGAIPDGAAFRAGVLGLRSGEHEIVLVAGGAKQSHRTALENLSGDALRSGHPILGYGLTPAGLSALFARRMMASGVLTREHLDAVVLKNRRMGESEPRAWSRFVPREQDLADAPLVSDPLSLLDIAHPADGAAAVVLCRSAGRKGAKETPIRVAGVGYQVAGGEVLPLFDPNTDFLTRPAARSACFIAYTQAGMVNPWSQIQVAEVDDLTSVGELLAYEDLAFCGRGECGEVIGKGFTGTPGQLPVNSSGGSLSFGSAPGADILRRIYAITRQLQGRADDRQVGVARIGVVHGAGGAGSEGFVSILNEGDV